MSPAPIPKRKKPSPLATEKKASPLATDPRKRARQLSGAEAAQARAEAVWAGLAAPSAPPPPPMFPPSPPPHPPIYFDVYTLDVGGTKLFGRLDLSGAERLTFGRDAEHVDVPLDHVSISRHHATIRFEGDVTYIADMKSNNGTFVVTAPGEADERVTTSRLREGSVLRFGLSPYRYVLRRSEGGLPRPAGDTWPRLAELARRRAARNAGRPSRRSRTRRRSRSGCGPSRSRPCRRRRRRHTTGTATGAATGAGGRRTRAIATAAGRRRVPAPTSASAWRTARRASGRRPVRPRSRRAWPTGRRALALRRVPAAGLRPARLPSRRASRTARRALALRRVPERATRAVATAGRAGRYRRMISHRASPLRRLFRTRADTRKIYVGNMRKSASDPEIKAFFAAAGEVTEVQRAVDAERLLLRHVRVSRCRDQGHRHDAIRGFSGKENHHSAYGPREKGAVQILDRLGLVQSRRPLQLLAQWASGSRSRWLRGRRRWPSRAARRAAPAARKRPAPPKCFCASPRLDAPA